MTPQATSGRDALDALHASLSDCLVGAELEEVRVPERFAYQGDYQKTPLRIQPRAFRGSDVSFARVVRVDGGDKVQVFNAVFFPATHSSLPILGCEILQFRFGVHLFVLDALPTSKAPGPWQASFARCRETLLGSFAASELPDWGRDVFSPEALLIRPKPSREQPVHAAPFADAVRELVDAWLLSCEASVAPADVDRDAIASIRARYLQQHAAEEPAGPFLGRIAGDAWADAFIHEFLFPQWLRNPADAPSWPMEPV